MSKSKSIAETPLMRQYFEAKERYPEAILLFRVGDFYETFSEDAIIASKVLGIVLTKRANGPGSHVELAGFTLLMFICQSWCELVIKLLSATNLKIPSLLRNLSKEVLQSWLHRVYLIMTIYWFKRRITTWHLSI